MRWKAKPQMEAGARRILTKFLWLPRHIDGETRWLERASINQTWECWGAYDWSFAGWVDQSFSDTTAGTSGDRRGAGEGT